MSVKDLWGISIDYKKFDKFVPAFLIRDVANIFFLTLNNKGYLLGDEFHESSEKKAEKWKKVFQWITSYFIHAKYMLPNGTEWIKDHGISSGSVFT